MRYTVPMEIESIMLDVGAAVSAAGADAWLWVTNFLVLIVLTLAVYMFAMREGGAGVISLNISLYCGYALYSVFPYRDAIIGVGATPLVQAILAVVLFVAATAGPFIIVMRLTAPSFGQLSFFQGLLLSLVAAVFLIALGYHVFEISDIYTFSDPLNQLFEPKGYFFYWFIAPLIGLYFLAR
jgi:hypothetical protein